MISLQMPLKKIFAIAAGALAKSSPGRLSTKYERPCEFLRSRLSISNRDGISSQAGSVLVRDEALVDLIHELIEAHLPTIFLVGKVRPPAFCQLFKCINNHPIGLSQHRQGLYCRGLFSIGDPDSAESIEKISLSHSTSKFSNFLQFPCPDRVGVILSIACSERPSVCETQ